MTADDLRRALRPRLALLPGAESRLRREHAQRRRRRDRAARATCCAIQRGRARARVAGAHGWRAAVERERRDAAFRSPNSRRCADTVMVAFSKGLGAPIGAALAGTREAMERAWTARKLFGGAMRQSGILAAAALYALDHHIDRLADDHANARELARGVATACRRRARRRARYEHRHGRPARRPNSAPTSSPRRGQQGVRVSRMVGDSNPHGDAPRRRRARRLPKPAPLSA